MKNKKNWAIFGKIKINKTKPVINSLSLFRKGLN